MPKSRFAFKSKLAKKQPKVKEEERVETLEMKSDNDYIVEDLKDTELRICQKELQGKENLRVKNLKNVKLVVTAVVKSFYALDLEGCKVYVGAVAGGSHLTGCQECEVHVATHQVRNTHLASHSQEQRHEVPYNCSE